MWTAEIARRPGVTADRNVGAPAAGLILMDLRQWGGISRLGHVQNSEHYNDMLQTVRLAPPRAIPRDALEAGLAVQSPSAEIHQPASHAQAKAKHLVPHAALAGKG
jgi:hypothetical protein